MDGQRILISGAEPTPWAPDRRTVRLRAWPGRTPTLLWAYGVGLGVAWLVGLGYVCAIAYRAFIDIAQSTCCGPLGLIR